MKLHFSKILLFVIPLNILVTSYQAHNTNKPSITTPHHAPTTTSRMLSECDIQSSNYDNDADMKSVKEIFDRQTSQRFEEYEERMKDKRQKRKEEREKNIEEIIEKDKKEKSLTEKIEKGCLKCGCGLGGVAASVGLFGGLGTYGWKTAAIAAAAKAEGDAAGVQALIKGLADELGIHNLYNTPLQNAITTETYNDAALISKRVIAFYNSFSKEELEREKYIMLLSYKTKGEAEGTQGFVEYANRIVGEAVEKAKKMTVQFTESQMASLEDGKIAEITAESSHLYSAIGYSVLAILIIVLVMLIFYLVLRYRRKKKMNKKAQYTKLLKE
ncbi:rifin PIR protein, putative [Plasmodium reichenowi]|uniref:Rifin PIR protein, putative n=1 Tax=Plasmodium reichenowi TaxID=5854 RepID=A0A2P9DKZ7_PLARE|nr:rifin PIR protein, putative [Plasmodium reichenowi]